MFCFVQLCVRQHGSLAAIASPKSDSWIWKARYTQLTTIHGSPHVYLLEVYSGTSLVVKNFPFMYGNMKLGLVAIP